MTDTPASPPASPASAPPVFLLGLGLDAPDPEHPLLRNADVIIGGRAVLAALASLPAERLAVDARVEDLYARVSANRAEGKRQVVLCSGDPLFFGLGARLAERLGPEALRIVPALSSLQAACALLGLPHEGVRSVSLHGRASLLPLAHALMAGGPVCVLLDEVHSPPRIAAWMTGRGCGGYVFHFFAGLGRTAEGRITARERWSLDAATLAAGNGTADGENGANSLNAASAAPGSPSASTPGPSGASEDSPGAPALLILAPLAAPARAFGLDDDAIAREKQLMTKGPLRAAALASLGIEAGHTVWDLGSGSGAVAVEAAFLARQGQVFAVERKAARAALIRENRRRFGAANLEIVEGELAARLPALRTGPASGPETGDPVAGNSGAAVAPDAAPGTGSGNGESAAPARPAWFTLLPPDDLEPPLPAPDRVFIGGGLGDDIQGREILRRAYAALKPGGRLLAHCVLLSSLELARNTLLDLGARLHVSCLHASAGSPLAGDMRLEGLNPVFLVRGYKPAAEGQDSVKRGPHA